MNKKTFKKCVKEMQKTSKKSYQLLLKANEKDDIASYRVETFKVRKMLEKLPLTLKEIIENES